jgi:hypothetical protein
MALFVNPNLNNYSCIILSIILPTLKSILNNYLSFKCRLSSYNSNLCAPIVSTIILFSDGEDEHEDGDADADDHPDGEEVDTRRRPAQTQQHF